MEEQAALSSKFAKKQMVSNWVGSSPGGIGAPQPAGNQNHSFTGGNLLNSS